MHGWSVAEAEVNVAVLQVNHRHRECDMKAFRVGTRVVNKGGQGKEGLTAGFFSSSLS